MLRSVRRSIFLKLLVVLIVTGGLVNVLVGGFFRVTARRSPRTAGRRLLVDHVHRFIEAMGTPPDRAKAEALTRQLPLAIRYDGPSGHWVVGEGAAAGADLTPTDDPRVRTAVRDRVFLIAVEEPPGRFLFAIDLRRERDTPEEWVAALVVLLTLVLAGAYLAIRWILRPLQWLTEGVHAVSAGNLDHRVRRRGDDDLGELAASFNVMTQRVRDMIQARWELLLNVSHELRSPLTRIKVALEFLPEAPARESIREDVLGMEAMVGEILETERLESPYGGLHRRTIDVASLATDVAQGFEGEPPGVALSVPEEPLVLWVDADRLRSAIRNVLENAVKHSDSVGPAVDLTVEREADGAVVRVRNRGTPIAPEELPLLFEPFYRVDKSRARSTGGYGLGLSLCRTILEKHGGSVTMTSDAREGTVVSLHLPGTIR
ncbi:MAG: HAMP domain-containing histidine kinase [Deltaproteobacteria bacterium]|nr:HAMP domain-containing histidine kinase [Deltaproteobacteria bacterium]